uniref:Uncharacterized protein n=1 Tax=Arundo donax TaxID=35708 RepID=A0A0A9E224_ARUDO
MGRRYLATHDLLPELTTVLHFFLSKAWPYRCPRTIIGYIEMV